MKGKGNDGSGNIPERDLWRTEQEFWETLHNQYNFTFDCCASKEDTKCIYFSSDFENETSSIDKAWMNPPFSNAKRMFEHFFKVVNSGVAIFRCDNLETSIWQETILPHCSWVWIPKGRLSYTAFDIKIRNNKGTRFPSALIGVNCLPPKMPGYILIPRQVII